jgi:glyoxylase-like metal-dependent hydrolase (beta-lactamase superfamily II)
MVTRWDVITIGNLSRNRYWGENDAVALRPALCTSTLIRLQDLILLVDPSISTIELMKAELDRRTGLKLESIDVVFITHAHGDHYAGLGHFTQAQWCANPQVATHINSTQQYSKTIDAVTEELLPGLEVISTPGHTLDHHSLRFHCEGLDVVIAGDAVMTQDFWRESRGYHNSVDVELATQTIRQLTACTDIIVPGHDNFFLTRRSR